MKPRPCLSTYFPCVIYLNEFGVRNLYSTNLKDIVIAYSLVNWKNSIRRDYKSQRMELFRSDGWFVLNAPMNSTRTHVGASWLVLNSRSSTSSTGMTIIMAELCSKETSPGFWEVSRNRLTGKYSGSYVIVIQRCGCSVYMVWKV